MSLQQAKNYLKQFNREQDIIEFDVSSATVELAAKALNCAPERIAKTLSFKINERAILIVLLVMLKSIIANTKKPLKPKQKCSHAMKYCQSSVMILGEYALLALILMLLSILMNHLSDFKQFFLPAAILTVLLN